MQAVRLLRALCVASRAAAEDLAQNDAWGMILPYLFLDTSEASSLDNLDLQMQLEAGRLLTLLLR